MIGVDYVRRMARYNRWQNENLYGAADRLSDEERRRERGAFFGSIQKTFSHLLWSDHYWMSRLRGTPWPSMTIAESTTLYFYCVRNLSGLYFVTRARQQGHRGKLATRASINRRRMVAIEFGI